MPDRFQTLTRWVAIAADDSAIIRDNVRTALEPRWQMFVARNGVEALELARTTPVRFILLDARMPRMDGIEACRHIRDLPHCGTVPITILTAYDEPPLRQRARQAGATSVVAKPFTFELLRTHIETVLTQSVDAADTHTDAEPQSIGSGRLDDREVLKVCRRADAAANHRTFGSIYEAVQALRDKDRY